MTGIATFNKLGPAFDQEADILPAISRTIFLLPLALIALGGCGGSKPPAPAQAVPASKLPAPARAPIQVPIPTRIPDLDANKYPQDTPERALASVIQSLSDVDFGYWYAWLIRPQDFKPLLDRYGGDIGKLVKARSAEKHLDAFRAQIGALQVMQEQKNKSGGETAGLIWTRFHIGEKGRSVVQFDRQPDGRWCMNTYVALDSMAPDAKPPAPAPPAPENPAAP